MDANVSDAVKIAQIAADSNETMGGLLLLSIFVVVMFWSASN